MNQSKKSKPIEQKRPSIKLDSLLREGRLKTVDPDIGDVWEELSKINKQEEKAFNQKIEKVKTKFKKLKIKTPSKSKATTKEIKNPGKASRVVNYYKSHKKWVLMGSVFIALTGVYTTVFRVSDSQSTLGDSTNASGQGSIADDGRIDSAPDFDLLYPSSKDESTLQKVTRKSPDGTIIHTFKDTVEGIGVEVTQQELPEVFKSALATELEKLATSFQATDVIQIDEQIVYHGLNDKTGIQSLITVKNGLLIFINSSQKISDDIWAGYITDLQ